MSNIRSAAAGGPAAVAAPVAGSVVRAMLASPWARGSSGNPTRILLTPTADPATSQTVSWTLPAKMSGQVVQYRLPGQSKRSVRAKLRAVTSVRFSGTAKPRYAATMKRLAPGTVYEYRIVTPTGSTPWRRFTTARTGRAPVALIGLGDTQVDNRGVPATTIRRAFADVPGASLVLQAGDVVDRPYRNSQWGDLFAAMGTAARTANWVFAIGNHEQCILIRCSSNRAEAFRSYFDWPTNGFPEQGETWYHIDYQGVRIVVLDSFGGQMARQASFLDRALATNPNRWSIVVMHAPPFATRPGRSNPEVRRWWLPIIEAHEVDLVLAGHDHSYARGHRAGASTVYAVSVSGQKYYPAVGTDWAANRATRDVWAAQTATYQVITISGDTLAYRAVVTDRGSGSTSPVGVGGVLDRFTIVKRASGAKVVR
ncbi:MAG: metallophosphoesterase family protein [Candidatus Nanopelagicales bacterium]